MVNYRLDRDESLADGARRILSELTEDASHHLRSKNVEEGIHEAREDFKKARGVARLVRSDLDDYHRVNRSFRDAGRALAPIRDPHAFREMFETLEVTPAATKQMRKLRSYFSKRARKASRLIKRKERDRLEEATSQMTAAHLDDDGWEIADEAATIESGLAKTYGRGREALEVATRSGNPDDFHEMRKRVKYLWYQVRLIQDAAPSILRPLASSLHDVSNALGDAHDLALMVTDVGDAGAKEESIAAFQIVAQGYMKELEARAVSLGSRLYVEEPGAFAGRLAAYWRLWRQGEELETGDIEVVMSSDDVSVQFA